MKNVLLFILFVTVLCNALILEQIQAELKKNMIVSDSVEMGIRTTISSPLISNVQGVSVYLVRKGNAKIFAELKMPLVNQRTIVNGNRMKTINLNTRESQVLPYEGETLKAHSYTNFNPLASGEWGEPKFVSENLYSIKGDKGTLFYNSKKKRIEKMETEEKDKFVLTEFSYDVENNLKTMIVHVSAQGVETTIVTEILKLRHSRDFPDKLFEF
jgi:hypothetical protein